MIKLPKLSGLRQKTQGITTSARGLPNTYDLHNIWQKPEYIEDLTRQPIGLGNQSVYIIRLCHYGFNTTRTSIWLRRVVCLEKHPCCTAGDYGRFEKDPLPTSFFLINTLAKLLQRMTNLLVIRWFSIDPGTDL